MLFPIELNLVLSPVPTDENPADAAIAMSEAKRPYSIAVAPLESRIILVMLRIFGPLVG